MIKKKQIISCGWDWMKKDLYCIIQPISEYEYDWYLEKGIDGRWRIDNGIDEPIFIGTITDEQHLKALMALNNIKTD